MDLVSRRVVDLTHHIHADMPVSIGFPRVATRRFLDQAAGDVATVEIVEMGLHTGTHVDAPMHFLPGAPSVDLLDPLALVGSAIVVHIEPVDRWHCVSRESLEAWEARTGERIGPSDIVLLRTGHARFWRDLPDGARYMTAPWPYLVRSAADLLVERGVKALGVECPDPDRVDQNDLGGATFEVHRRLLGAGILIIENLANLDRLTALRVDFLALGLPLRSCSGSPVRALAFLPD